MITWKWNNVELEIDMEDYEFQSRYEKSFQDMEVKEEKIKKIGNLSDITKAYCEMFFELFDNIFESGTSEKLFSGKINSRLVDECYDSFITTCRKEVEIVNKKRSQMVSKYKVKSRK